MSIADQKAACVVRLALGPTQSSQALAAREGENVSLAN